MVARYIRNYGKIGEIMYNVCLNEDVTVDIENKVEVS